MFTHRAPSKKALLSAFRDLSPESAELIRAIIQRKIQPESAAPQTADWVRVCHGRPNWLDRTMHAIDTLLENHGVESVVLRISRNTTERLTYSNSGDHYTPTICYWRGQFRLTTYGDIAERFDRFQEYPQ